jgi:hypothetical protein
LYGHYTQTVGFWVLVVEGVFAVDRPQQKNNNKTIKSCGWGWLAIMTVV